jgi:hypothetical protein
VAAEAEVLTIEWNDQLQVRSIMRDIHQDGDWTKINVSGAATVVIVFGILAIACAAIGVGILSDTDSMTPRSERTSVLVFVGLSLLCLTIVLATAVRHVRRNHHDPALRRRAMNRIWFGLGGMAAGAVIVAGTNLLKLPGGVYAIPTGIFVAALAAIATTMGRPD